MEYRCDATEFKKKPRVLERCKLASHTHTHTQTHTATASPHYCLFVFIAIQASVGYIHHVRQERGESSLSPHPASHKHSHAHTHTQREISCQGALQWISVLTQVIAFLLGSLRVLIQLDEVCSPVRDSESGGVCFFLSALQLSARTTSMACAVVRLTADRTAESNSLLKKKIKKMR